MVVILSGIPILFVSNGHCDDNIDEIMGISTKTFDCMYYYHSNSALSLVWLL